MEPEHNALHHTHRDVLAPQYRDLLLERSLSFRRSLHRGIRGPTRVRGRRNRRTDYCVDLNTNQVSIATRFRQGRHDPICRRPWETRCRRG